MKRTKILKRLTFAFFSIIAIVIVTSSNTTNVFATDAVTKSKMNAVYECYKKGQMTGILTSNEWKGMNGIERLAKTTSSVAVLPDSSTGEVTWTNCRSLISEVAGSKAPSSSAQSNQLTPFLTGMGYQAESQPGSGGVCAAYEFSSGNGSNTLRLCAPQISSSLDPMSGTLDHTWLEISNGVPIGIQINKYGTLEFIRNGRYSGSVSWSKGDTFEDYANKIYVKFNELYEDKKFDSGWSIIGGAPTISSGGDFTTYKLPDNEEQAGLVAVKYLSNNAIVRTDQMILSPDERKIILQYALNTYYKISYFGGSEASACNLSGSAASNAQSSGYTPMKISSDKTCYVKPTAHINDKVLTYNKTTGKTDGTQMDFSQLIEAVDAYITTTANAGQNPNLSLTPTTPGGEDPVGPNNDTDGSNDGQDGTLSTCFENAGVLGWIVCPVTEALGNVVGGIYEYIEMNYLQVRSDVIDSSGLREGWTTFRDFANILFAIAFTVVIFAQITGFGISNYNVKKILPRLLVIVVLVNISFILCQLATDISNIVGASIKDMFVDFASKARTQLDYNIPSIVGGFIKALGLTAAIGGGAIALGMTTNWRLWIFPLLLSLGGCLLGVLFFFIILGVRQAGIIILIVLAPLAIVCYALPNTKNLFDKWWKMFSALLILYPICGALMGGGQFASALLLNTVSDSEGGLAFMSIVAMLLNVMPFFLVPSLLKSSMAAMGNIGTKISQFGQKQTGRLQGAIRGSQGFKDLQWGQQFKTDNAQVKRFQRIAKNNDGKLPKRHTRTANMRMQRLAKSQRELAMGGDLKNAITIGSEAERNLRSSVQRQQANEDVLGRQGRYINGEMTSILPGREDQIVNGRNADELGAELDAYLDKIIAGDGSAEELENYNRNAQAIINTLSDMNTAGSRAKVINSLAKNVSKHSGKLTGPLDEQEKARLKGSFGRLQSSIEKYAKDYKKDNPESPRLIGDLAAGEFKNAGKLQELSDQENPNSTFWRSSAYVDKGLSGMNTEDFSKLKPQALQSILHGMRNGEVSSRSINTLARIADEALSPDSIFKPDADSYRYIEQIRSAAYAHGAMADGSTMRSVGSQAIGRASSTSLRSITSEIKSAPSWQDLSANAASSDPAVKAAATADMTKYSNLVTNIQQSLASDMHSEESAAQLQEALQIAHDKGFQDTSGQVVRVNKISPQNLKLQHSTQPAPAPRTPTSTPSQNSNNILTRNPDSTLSGKVGPVVVSGAEESPGGIIIVQEDADIRTRRQQQQQNHQNNNQNNNP